MPGCNFQYGSAIGSNIIHRPLSQAEILSSTNTPQTQYNSHIANLDIIGGGTVYLGGNTCHSGIHLISDPNNTSTTSNYIGYWNVWNSPNWRSNTTAYVFSADVIGSNNYIGLGTNHTTVRGKNNYTPAHSTSVAIYGDDFKKPFSSSFSEKLKLDGITDDDLKSILHKEVSFADLTKFALEYSDGAVIASPSVNKELADYVAKSGKLYLPTPDADNYVDAYNEFYDKVLESCK
jgi:hypothetical protein